MSPLRDQPEYVQQLAREVLADYADVLEARKDVDARYQLVRQKVYRLRGMNVGQEEIAELLGLTHQAVKKMTKL